MSYPIAPVALFVYERYESMRNTVESLRRNKHAAETDLFIFCDGTPVTSSHEKLTAINNVQTYARLLLGADAGFKSVTVQIAPVNRGLSRAVIDGVSQLMRDYPAVIVVEDDLELAPSFLAFMNQALCVYEHRPEVVSVSGYTFPIHYDHEDYDVDATFTSRASSWGWATWRNRWEDVDWEVRDYDWLRRSFYTRWRFNSGGSDMSRMLDRQMRGEVDSWAIRFCFHQFKYELATVIPRRTLVRNTGFGTGTHCTVDVRGWVDTLDMRHDPQFGFPQKVKVRPEVMRQFRSFNSYSARFLRVFKRTLLNFGVRR